MSITFRFTLDWFVAFAERDLDTGAPRTRYLAHAKHVYAATAAEAISKRQWHEADVERWLPDDAYRGTDPGYVADISDIVRIERRAGGNP
jgi:hypothetical protein